MKKLYGWKNFNGRAMRSFMNLFRFLAIWFGVIAILSISSASVFAAEKLAPAGSKQGPEISEQDSDAQKNSWLLGVIFKLERMKDNSAADIQKYEREIQKSENTIRKSEDIIRQAQQKGNINAEQIARSALTTAQEAKRKNEELKRLAELNKKRAETERDKFFRHYASVYHKLEIRGVVSSVSGDAFIRSKNETIPLSDNRAGFLQPGDEIWTLGKSSAELQVLEGIGALKLGEYSRFRMEEDSAGTQIVNMINGKIYVAIDKLDEYQKMLEEKLKEYKENISDIPEDYERFVKGLRAKARKKFEVRTHGGVMTIRGTEFLVFEDDKTGTAIIVLEGSVEMKGTKGDKTIIVNAGYKGTVTKDGILSDPDKIDISNLERWWER